LRADAAAARWGEPFTRGALLFDEGAFFEAHEAWEELWLVERDTDAKRALQGLIQIAAGYHKLFAQDRPESAARLLQRGLEKLAASEEAQRWQLSAFCDAVRGHVGKLAAVGSGERFGRADVPMLAR